MKHAVIANLILSAGLFGASVSAHAISISVEPANVVCAVSVSGQATGSKGIPATNVSIYVEQGTKSTPLVVNQALPADGKFTWSGVVPGVTSLQGATVKAVTNRQTAATAGINGSCSTTGN